MSRVGPTHVKICCIASVEEARIAVEMGAAAVGLVSEMPSGPGPIPEPLIAQIVATVPPGVATFLLTCKTDAPSIIAQQQRTGVNTVQFVDCVPTETYAALRQALPGALGAIEVVQVIHVTGPEALEAAVRIAPHVDALLLDSGNPALPVKELGGTGRVHDWRISRAIREAVAVSVFLAGGLTPDNVAEAIAQVRPYAVDVCNGVRTNGVLDAEKLRKFMTAAGP